MLGYAIMEAQAEAFSLAVKAGIDPLDFWQALRLGMESGDDVQCDRIVELR